MCSSLVIQSLLKIFPTKNPFLIRVLFEKNTNFNQLSLDHSPTSCVWRWVPWKFSPNRIKHGPPSVCPRDIVSLEGRHLALVWRYVPPCRNGTRLAGSHDPATNMCFFLTHADFTGVTRSSSWWKAFHPAMTRRWLVAGFHAKVETSKKMR